MTRALLYEFLKHHRLAVVSTLSPTGQPQAAVVGIAVTDQLEIVFDTQDNTRKCQNLRANSRAAVVIGWDEEVTVQLEGVADEPTGAERESILSDYLAAFPDGRERMSWAGITHFRVRPSWIRYSDFNAGGQIVELSGDQLR